MLERVGAAWTRAIASTPFWAEVARREDLPADFDSLAEFAERVPRMTRSLVQAMGSGLLAANTAPDFERRTGGSTGEPIAVPGSNAEVELAAANLWYGREMHGIRPSDRAYLVWGHSHLLGDGVGRVVGKGKQLAKDLLLGYRRHSAYDMGDDDLRGAVDSILSFRPGWILGYSGALDRLARVNEDRSRELAELDLKAVVATAEAFPAADGASVVSDVFGCPVVMEYGAVETGPIAYECPDGGYLVFWRDFYVEGVPVGGRPGEYSLLVTSLAPRCLPLVRYELGDVVRANPEDPISVSFFHVIGRSNDYVVLGDDRVHSEAFAHAIKGVTAIAGFQVVQQEAGDISIRYRALHELTDTDRGSIRRRLSRIHPALAEVAFEPTSEFEMTRAGKTPVVVRRRSEAA